MWYRTVSGFNSNNHNAPGNPRRYNRDLALGILNANSSIGVNQPQIIPVLNIHTTTGDSGAFDSVDTALPGRSNQENTLWLQPASGSSIFNLIMAIGDVAGHPGYTAPITHLGNTSGGAHNLPRFLENWEATTFISGTLIELRRSRFATAPFRQINRFPTVNSEIRFGIFNEIQNAQSGVNNGRVVHYNAPERNWGFDVGLLAQQPDLLASRFTITPGTPPNDFVREVARDDAWVETLLCAFEQTSPGNFGAPTSYERPGGGGNCAE
ncbi:MAG: hypothetical protein HC890_05600 [Chloroflexaceae bacterium]|nr:hypothetical protein [Chloroflexaceae bacterium]